MKDTCILKRELVYAAMALWVCGSIGRGPLKVLATGTVRSHDHTAPSRRARRGGHLTSVPSWTAVRVCAHGRDRTMPTAVLPSNLKDHNLETRRPARVSTLGRPRCAIPARRPPDLGYERGCIGGRRRPPGQDGACIGVTSLP
jgi:hypothetical protein